MRATTPRVELDDPPERSSGRRVPPSTLPKESVRTTERDAGSMFEIEWSSVFATHTPPTRRDAAGHSAHGCLCNDPVGARVDHRYRVRGGRHSAAAVAPC